MRLKIEAINKQILVSYRTFKLQACNFQDKKKEQGKKGITTRKNSRKVETQEIHDREIENRGEEGEEGRELRLREIR